MHKPHLSQWKVLISLIKWQVLQYLRVYGWPPTIFLIFEESNLYRGIGVPLCLPGSDDVASIRLSDTTIVEIQIKNIKKLYLSLSSSVIVGIPLEQAKHIVNKIVKNKNKENVIKNPLKAEIFLGNFLLLEPHITLSSIFSRGFPLKVNRTAFVGTNTFLLEGTKLLLLIVLIVLIELIELIFLMLLLINNGSEIIF